MTMNKPMRVVEGADGVMKKAGALFSDYKSIMKQDEYLTTAQDLLVSAKEFRQGVEANTGKAQANQAKLYAEQAQKALDAVKKAIAHAGG